MLNYYKVVGGKLLEWSHLKGSVTIFIISDMCHVYCPSHPQLDHLTNLQTTDHDIAKYVVQALPYESASEIFMFFP
jgi:hypothetical protein